MELSHSNCTDPMVFGGDDLTQLETTNFTDLEGIKRLADGRLYFTTFAWTPGREPIPHTSVGASRENLYDRLRTLRDFLGASGRLTFDRTGAGGTSGADPADKLAAGQIVKLDNGFLASHHGSYEGT